MKTIWNKQTGVARDYESVDAREIMKNSDVYTDQNPNPGDPKDPDRDGVKAGPQNVATVENEFRREPVGDDVPGPEREGVIIRNPVTDQPRMAPRADDRADLAVNIPDNWQAQPLSDRRALAMQLGGHAGMTQSEVDPVIQAEVDRRAKVEKDRQAKAQAAAAARKSPLPPPAAAKPASPKPA